MKKSFGLAFAGLTIFIAPQFAQAGLVLTQAGIDDGFVLSTFATLNPGLTGCCSGPFGMAINGNGKVIIYNDVDQKRYIFNDVDGQTQATALSSTAASSYVVAYASVGGKAYGGTVDRGGSFVQFNDDGTINHTLTGLPATFLGMWGNPNNGHIIAGSQAGLIDINPLAAGGAGTFTVINATVFPDGVSLSADGSIAYVESAGLIQAYSTSTGNLLANLDTSGNPDGSGVIYGGTFNGYVIANTNNGNIDLINPANNTFATIATGGTRGDYTAPDTNNGTLLLAYSDIVARLSCASGCSIGTVVTPEPSSALLLIAGLGLLGLRKLVSEHATGCLACLHGTSCHEKS